jgi:hypothetical protein
MTMSNTPAPRAGGGTSWTVTGVSKTVGQDSTGRYTPGWEVTYQIDSGHTGVVFLPGADLSPDAARAAVAKQAQALAATAGLTDRS